MSRPSDFAALWPKVSYSEQELVERYRKNYGLGPDIGIEHVRAHATLEYALTGELLASSPENRWNVFSDAYSRLYEQLPWLNAGTNESNLYPDIEAWGRLIGTGKRVFEVGSGKGQLISFLASRGNTCVGTEITKERGKKHVTRLSNLTWNTTDGVNLTTFESSDSFDFIISDQVFEHLHPDDHVLHLSEALRLLRPGGRYILRAPHGSSGPHDLSLVFGFDRPVFMHLFEPSYKDMRRKFQTAGYTTVKAVLPPYFHFSRLCRPSKAFLYYQLIAEHLEEILCPTQRARSLFRRIGRFALVRGSVWVVAER